MLKRIVILYICSFVCKVRMTDRPNNYKHCRLASLVVMLCYEKTCLVNEKELSYVILCIKNRPGESERPF